MAHRAKFLARLLELPRIEDANVRKRIFRQTITALALDDAMAPMALAGVDAQALARSVRIAGTDGLLDDLGFIGPAAAGVALYQLGNGLPLGDVRRAVGRKVLLQLYQGNAETFASIASRMALSSSRALSGAGIRARIALALGLRGRADTAVDRLALAICSRRELSRRWVHDGAIGSLPDRRLAAQLLERAAREAARQAGRGDPHALRTFDGIGKPLHAGDLQWGDDGGVAAAWRSLFADRETLVWRHVAIGRGLLSGCNEEVARGIRADLDPSLSPTEWRRAATSLTASIAVDHTRGLSETMALLDGPLMQRDQGIAMAMVWGLPPVAEVEPEAAEELLDAIALVSPISVADTVVELRHTVPGFGESGVPHCIKALKASMGHPELDDGLSGLASAILRDLESPGNPRPLVRAIQKGLEAFGSEGSNAAYMAAQLALPIANDQMAELERLQVTFTPDPDASRVRCGAVKVLRDLDGNLMESRTLQYLLLLGRAPGKDGQGIEAIDDLSARMSRWLLDPRRRKASGTEIDAQSTLHQRQLRVLLHLVDGESTDFGDDHERRLRVRSRWSAAARELITFVRERPNTRLTRGTIATAARALDALVRDGAAEATDVLLYAARALDEPIHLRIVGEASMQPDVVRMLGSFAALAGQTYSGNLAEQAEPRLHEFRLFLESLPPERTLRSEAFRTSATRLLNSLQALSAAESLSELIPVEATETGPLAVLEDAIVDLQQLCAGAERRCTEALSHPIPVLSKRHAIARAVEASGHADSNNSIVAAVTALVRLASSGLPGPMARLVASVCPRLTALPFESDRESMEFTPAEGAVMALPDWVPARRVLGGFYVERQLGGGNVGTVFVVKRAEERHDSDAKQFALKVPEYNATAARTMSEAEFLALFREEAGALLSIPEHPNIARFVTFDAGAKPKPLLVMELVVGHSCERLLTSRSLTMESAIKMIHGVMEGLVAMHQTGIAHLDVKPSNAIARASDGTVVLVDFGLAGRKVRPGCATLCYGAPEVWEEVPAKTYEAYAPAADVYATACFVYEVLTGTTLFDGNTDVAIIANHLKHDGLPEPLKALAADPMLQPLAQLLYHGLRNRPPDRVPMTAMLEQFRAVTPTLQNLPWPLKPKPTAS